MLKLRPRQPKSSYEASILLACETSIRRVARGCCSFPLRSSVRSKRIELSQLLRNLFRTLTVRNPEFLLGCSGSTEIDPEPSRDVEIARNSGDEPKPDSDPIPSIDS